MVLNVENILQVPQQRLIRNELDRLSIQALLVLACDVGVNFTETVEKHVNVWVEANVHFLFQLLHFWTLRVYHLVVGAGEFEFLKASQHLFARDHVQKVKID